MQDHATPTLSPLLGIYLSDHLAAEAAVLDRARLARARNRENNVGTVVGKLLPELEQDHRTIEQVLRRLAFSPSRAKAGVLRVAERVGRLKPNGRILRYSPLSRVLDLEVLILSTEGKRALWSALRDVAEETDRLVGFDFDALMKRAEEQRAALREQHANAVARAFFRPGRIDDG